jgi:MATE family multidrug resistance protein
MNAVSAAPDAALSPWRREIGATWRLALPIVVTQLAQVSIMTADVVMLGWLGPEALAAGAMGWNLVFIVTIFGFGICMATAPMMAQAIGRGRGKVRDVRRSMRQGFWAAAILALAGWMLLALSAPILLLLRQDAALVAPAAGYVDILAWGVLPTLWFMVLRQFLAVLERPRAALVVQVLAFFLNVVGNYALIFGHFGMPALGLNGAAVASAVANWFAFLALLGFVLTDRRMRRYLLLEVTVFAAAVYVLGAIGTEQLAAHQIAIQCASITFMVPFGLAQAATVRVGIAAGAGDRAGVRRAGWAALSLGLAFMAAMALTLWLLRWPIAELFLDASQPQSLRVAQYAVEFLAVAAVFQIFDGAQAIAMGALRGLKDTRLPMLIAALGYWALGFTAGCFAAFVLGMDGLGVWIGLAIGLAVVAALATARFAARERLGLVP